MAQPFAPYFQPLDANGAPLAGAKLYFYVTTTTTAATVYQNVALSTPHAQPVVADGAGRFPPIFLSDAVTYRAVLKDASDVAVGNGDLDPINYTPPTANADVYEAAASASSSAVDAQDAADAVAGATVAQLNFGTQQSYTIASDAVTLTNSNCKLDTEAAAASDNLSTINGGTVGQCVILRTTSSARDVVVKDGVGNLVLAGDCTLDVVSDTLLLFRDGGQWYELARSNNA